MACALKVAHDEEGVVGASNGSITAATESDPSNGNRATSNPRASHVHQTHSVVPAYHRSERGFTSHQ